MAFVATFDGITSQQHKNAITPMKLNDTKCRSLKPLEKTYRISDGGGLYIEVMPNGGTYWRMNYRFLGKQKRLAFGVYPRVTLKEAREKRDEAKKLLDAGIDPSAEKKIAKIEHKVKYDNNFEALAREWHTQKIHTWKPDHAAVILRRLETNIFPYIGQRPIKEIRTSELLNAVRTLETEGKRDLAHRMLQHCGQIFRYAVATGRAEFDITPNLKGALQPAKSRNYARLEESQLPNFLRKLDKYDTQYKGNTLTKLAFQLLIHTFVRSGEIRGAKWDEIDFDKALWRIPAERMKMKDQHLAPLSTQSIEILKQVQSISGNGFSGYLFPSQNNPRNMMSENTFLRAIEIMGYKGKTTGHGFRATASTILNENGFRPDVIERQLAHAERDQIRAAYNHAEYLAERKDMMQWWGDYLEKAA
jgi:integrase